MKKAVTDVPAPERISRWGTRMSYIVLVGVFAACLTGFGLLRGGVGFAADNAPKGEIMLAFGPGQVLTRDGTLWQYRPDKATWLTMDQAFAEEGRKTHVHPLPVPATQIAQMQSFGFLVTTSGSCWFYDLEKDRWKEIGAPPVSH
jgi:hypothetical protein